VKDSDSENDVISEDPITAEYESSSQSVWWKKGSGVRPLS